MKEVFCREKKAILAHADLIRQRRLKRMGLKEWSRWLRRVRMEIETDKETERIANNYSKKRSQKKSFQEWHFWTTVVSRSKVRF